MKKGFTVLSVVLFTGVLAAGAFAQPLRGRTFQNPRFNRAPSHFLMILRHAGEELNMTEEQKDKIKAIFEEHEENMLKMRQSAQTMRLELKKLMRNETRDYDRIKKAMEAISANRHDMVIARMKMMDGIKNILTKEQQDKLKELRLDRFRGRRELFRRGEGLRRFPRFPNRVRR